jgi:DNA-binding FadR family transcriptional regulator
MIRAGVWSDGGHLPPERELSAKSGLSRASVRDALRILELEGLVEIRSGRSGGTLVRRPALEHLSRSLDLFVWSRKVSSKHIVDMCAALAALGARQAARNRTEHDIRNLTQKADAVAAAAGEVRKYESTTLVWCVAIMQAAKNPLLASFMEVLHRAIADQPARRAQPLNARAKTTVALRRIVAAIATGDADTAGASMAQVVGQTWRAPDC